LIGVVFVVSAIAKLVPGDIVDMMEAGNPGMSAADKDRLREQLGVTQPLPQYFARYLVGIVSAGDLGQSLRFRAPAAGLIAERVPATLELALTAILIAVVIALPLGIACALRQGSLIDYAGSVLAVLGVATPGFLVGVVLILVFSVELGWLPSSGYKG